MGTHAFSLLKWQWGRSVLLHHSNTAPSSHPNTAPVSLNGMASSSSSPLKLVIMSILPLSFTLFLLLFPPKPLSNLPSKSRLLLESSSPPPDASCSAVRRLPAERRCPVALAHCRGDSPGLLNYAAIHFCLLAGDPRLSLPALFLLLLLHFYFLVSAARDHFTPVVTRLAANLRLSPLHGRRHPPCPRQRLPRRLRLRRRRPRRPPSHWPRRHPLRRRLRLCLRRRRRRHHRCPLSSQPRSLCPRCLLLPDRCIRPLLRLPQCRDLLMASCWLHPLLLVLCRLRLLDGFGGGKEDREGG